MTRGLYTILLYLLAPAIWLWMALRGRRSGHDWDILGSARFGKYDGETPPAARWVWVHAVSLGETRAAQPLISLLLEMGYSILLTHTTATGRAEGARLFAEAMANHRLRQTWLPYDLPGSVRRFLGFFRPICGILIEREVWPNLIHEAARQQISVVLVSARLSENSMRQSRWLGRALRKAYATLDLVLAQTPADAGRLRQAGAFGPHVMGNLKFDVDLDKAQLELGAQMRRSLARPIVAIASTREGEEDLFAAAIAGASAAGAPRGILHLLIPRHPQRFSEAADTLEKYHLGFERRSESGDVPAPGSPVLLGDTLGEMAFYYGAADVAIIGGSFVPLGGQNLIEACAAGTPVIFGPSMHNFQQPARDAIAAGAAIQVTDAPTAISAAYALINDPARLARMRAAALAWSESHKGAARRAVESLRPWLGAPTEDSVARRC